MFDYGIVKGLSDAELQAAAKGGSAIPGWLAVSELASRNAIRASAPVQAPQSTVADSVISQSMQGLGTPQNTQQSQLDAPQGNPNPQPTPTASFAKGGAVGHYASGGLGSGSSQPVSTSDMLQGLGMIPAYNPVPNTPTVYSPGAQIDASAQTLPGAVSEVAQQYGPSPDFKGDIDQVDQNLSQNGVRNYGVGEYLTDLVGNILGGKGNALQNFGAGLVNTNENERKQNQLNFTNTDSANKQKLAIQSKIQDRQKDIENQAQEYNKLQQTIADNEAQRKAAIDQGNNEAAQRAAEANNTLQMKRSELLNSSMKDLSNPIFSKVLSTQAMQAGKPDVAKYLSDLSDHTQKQILAQKQQESNIEQQRQMAVEGARIGNEFKLASFKHDLDNMDQVRLMQANGERPEDIEAATGIKADPAYAQKFAGKTPAPLATGHQDNGMPPPIVAPGGVTAPPVEAPTASSDLWGQNLLKTGTSGAAATRGGKYAEYVSKLANMGMAKIQQQYGIGNNEIMGIRSAYKQAADAQNQIQKIASPVLTSEDTVNRQLPALVSLAKKLQNKNLDFNSAPDAVKKAVGEDGYQSLQLMLKTIPNEYAAVQGKGQPTDSLREEGRSLLNNGMSSHNIEEAAKTMQFEMDQRNRALRDSLASANYRTTSIPALLQQVRTGTPAEHPAVAAYNDLPVSNGKKMDAATFDKFKKVAQLRLGVSDVNAPGVKQEVVKMAKAKGYGGI